MLKFLKFFGTVSWWDSNTLQKFQFFFKWKNLRRDKTILNEHLDDPGWSRSRGIKNSYHKWIHMATTNEVHYSTFNFLLISQKSFYRIFRKNVFLYSLKRNENEWCSLICLKQDTKNKLRWISNHLNWKPFKTVKKFTLDVNKRYSPIYWIFDSFWFSSQVYLWRFSQQHVATDMNQTVEILSK